MSPSSGSFLALLALIFFLHRLVETRPRTRLLLLAALGLGFHALAGWKPLLVVLALAALNHFAARRAGNKFWLRFTVIAHLAALVFYKYAEFAFGTAADGLGLAGFNVVSPRFAFVVPLGLSFFTFQSVAYAVDVARKNLEPAHDFPEYLAFIAFFPAIQAGPISRGAQLLPQLRNFNPIDAETGGRALFLIGWGCLKKIAIADYLAINFTQRVFDFPERFSSIEVLAAVYGYAAQIYCDFSGYTDIAIGAALLLGVRLPENFRRPYRATDLADFWRRWHISLSNWLRDYVFFSIAGKRLRNVNRLYVATVATMLIGGFWHGATWNFIIWGAWHGFGLLGLRLLERQKLDLFARFPLPDVFRVFGTFNFVCAGWIFFGTETLAAAVSVFRQLLSFTGDTTNLPWPVVAFIAVPILGQFLPDTIFHRLQTAFTRLPAPAQAFALALLACGLYRIASSDVVPFLYARF